MNDSFWTPLLLSCFAGSATIFGFLGVLYAKAWVQKATYAIVSLAAGVLLGTAFFHLLPEAHELLGESVFLWLLLGFLIFFLFEALVGIHACREGETHHDHVHVLGPVASLGLFFHSLLDGVVIAVGHEIDPHLGLITAIAVLVHELPEGIFTFSILKHSQTETKKAAWMTVTVALATPLGTLFTLLFFPHLPEEALGILIALAAGSFLYVSASDLVPESHKSRSIKTSLFLVFGLVLMYLINGLF